MSTLIQDLRYALRQLRRSPGFTVAALFTLALGIGATTAIFSVVNGVLLQPLPFSQANRLVTVWLNNPRQGFEKDITSYPNFSDWRRQSRSFQQVVGVLTRDVNLTGEGAPEEVREALVTEGFFAMLGVEPALGRGLRDEEHQTGRDRIVVLSHELWQRRFGGDPAVLGKTVRLNRNAHTVVGVMPRGVRFPQQAELWTPLAASPAFAEVRESRGALWLPVFGRLADGVSLAKAQAEMSAIARNLEKEYPANREMGILLEPLEETLLGEVRPALLVLLGAVGFVLLIACANVGNLLLARGAARRRELSVRAALGAGGARLRRQLLTESLLLGLGGGGAGLLLAHAGVRALLRASPENLPRVEAVNVDATVLLFTLATALLAGLLVGLAPALHAARVAPGAVLREGGRGAAGGRLLGRLRPALVAGQFALALVLLVGAGLLIRSFDRLQRVDLGYEPRNVLSFRLSLPPQKYDGEDRVRAFYDELLPLLEALPGVESADAVSSFFLGRLPQSSNITVEGRPEPPVALKMLPVAYDAVTPGFFRTLRIPLLQGRSIEALDGSDATRVAVVNETFVRRFLPDERPLGRRFLFGDSAQGEDPPWITIVGVVADARRSGVDREAHPSAYLPMAQYSSPQMNVMVRTLTDPLGLVEPVRAAVAAVDPEQPLADVRTLEQAVSRSVADRRFVMLLLGLFAGVALSLAAVGIYAVMAYVVGHRAREIGIRVALGARRQDVGRLVIGEGMKVVGFGLLLGLGGALVLTRLLRGLLYQTSPLDPMTLLLGAAVLSSVALVANWLPASRAARMNPLQALRNE